MQRRALEAHWRASLLGMRLGAMLGCSGWPPRSSRPWTWYAHVATPLTSIARAAMVYMTFDAVWSDLPRLRHKQSTVSAEVYEFALQIHLCAFLIKNVGLTLVQVVMVRRSHELSLLVRAALLHLKASPIPRRKYETRATAVLCFGAAPIVYSVAMLIIDISSKSLPRWVTTTYGLNDMLPVLCISIAQDTFIHMLSVSIDFLASIADDVQELINTPSRVVSPVDKATCSVCLARRTAKSTTALARSVRALRVRYQEVRDGVNAANHVYALFNVVCNTTTTVQGVICLYTAVIIPYGPFKRVWTLVWGTVLTAKLLFVCIIGEQILRQNSRITAALQTKMAHHPNMDPQIKAEIRGFLQQVQMQEIRFRAVDPYYFDLNTMKRIFASTMALLVVLVQFTTMLKHFNK